MSGKGRNMSHVLAEVESEEAKLDEMKAKKRLKVDQSKAEMQGKVDEAKAKKRRKIDEAEAEMQCKVGEAEAEVVHKETWIKKMREDYKRMCDFEEQLVTLQKNLGKTTFPFMEVTSEVQRCFQEAKD